MPFDENLTAPPSYLDTADFLAARRKTLPSLATVRLDSSIAVAQFIAVAPSPPHHTRDTPHWRIVISLSNDGHLPVVLF